MGGLPPRKDLLVKHNAIIKAAGSKKQPPATPSVAESIATTTKSRWDDAPISDCLDYIKSEHKSWGSALKGMDISDVCPNWRKERSDIGGGSRVGNMSDVGSNISGPTSVARSVVSVATATSRQSRVTAASSVSRRTSGSTLQVVRDRKQSQQIADKENNIDLGISGINVSAGTPSAPGGAARKVPPNGYSNSGRSAGGFKVSAPSQQRGFTSSARPRPAPRQGPS
eukprot:TRINITY_DN7746_c0_g1_i1.p1 TRINITY_DN7746_c0_g1~~TRINITY_DN7746_c0_g1_i1.p1  ORF type:complete len:226 (+),score=38.61 TRINITY_DN7746_c0_g1_i1:54-731(+)